MVAMACGPSNGGILADNIASARLRGLAVISVVSLIAIRACPGRGAQHLRNRPPRGPRMRDHRARREPAIVTGLAAMPAKVILTGVCFTCAALHRLDRHTSAGRAHAMVYAVMMVLIVPSAKLPCEPAARSLCHRGLLISGCRPVPAHSAASAPSSSFWARPGAVDRRSALVAEHCQEDRDLEHAVYGVYRLPRAPRQRVGRPREPARVFWGYKGAFVAISGLVLVCGIARDLQPRLEPPGARGMSHQRVVCILLLALTRADRDAPHSSARSTRSPSA